MKRTLFIHIPKNGGMAIRNAPQLEERVIIANRENNINKEYITRLETSMVGARMWPGWCHVRWRDVQLDVRGPYSAMAMVRNPWDRTLSRFLFAHRMRRINKIQIPDKHTFEEFINDRHLYGGKPFFWHSAIRGWFQQLDHVVDHHGELKCDILRFDKFHEDTSKYFGIEDPIQPTNVSNGVAGEGVVKEKKDYRRFYTDETREIIADWYKDDIKFFGFTFDTGASRNIWNKS